MFNRYISDELRDEITNCIATFKAEDWEDLPAKIQVECTCIYLKEFYRLEPSEYIQLDQVAGNNIIGLLLEMMLSPNDDDKVEDFTSQMGAIFIDDYSKTMSTIFDSIFADYNSNEPDCD